MIDTFDIGRLFFCKFPLSENAPLVHTSSMSLARWPYWQGYLIILNVRGTGRCVGWWYSKHPKESEHDLLLKPLKARDLTERLPKYTGERTVGSELANPWGVDKPYETVESAGYVYPRAVRTGQEGEASHSEDGEQQAT
jgi:hypothetical protein